MSTAENLDRNQQTQPPEQPAQRSLWREAQAAIRIRGEQPYVFTPLAVKGESLSETIIRERRGDFDEPLYELISRERRGEL